MNRFLMVSLAFIVLFGASGVTAQVMPSGGPAKPDQAVLEPLTRFDSAWTYAFLADDRYAYIDSFDSIAVVDTVNPAYPVQVASIPINPDNHALALKGGVLYVRASDGFLIYDVSVPTNPHLVNNYDQAGMGYEMVIVGNYAYLLDYSQGWVILDISDPVNPVFVSANNQEDIRKLYVEGQHAYGIGMGGFIIYDISNPSAPALLGRYQNPPSFIGEFTVYGNYAYYTGSIDRFPDPPEYYTDVVDISDPAAPERITDLPQLAEPFTRLLVDGDLLYALRQPLSGGGLAIFTLADPLDPQPLSIFPVYWGADLVTQGNRVLLLDLETGLYVLDTTDPAHPLQVGSFGWPQAADYLTAYGDWLFTLDRVGDHGPDGYVSTLRAIDVANPFAARVTDSASLNGEVLGKPYVNGSYVYIPTSTGVQIVDAADPADLHIVATTGMTSTFIVEVMDAKAYSASRNPVSGGALSIIDVSHPETPTLLSQTPYAYILDMSVALQGGVPYAYIITDAGLVTLNVTDPAQSVEVHRDLSVNIKLDTETIGGQTIAYLLQPAGITAQDVTDPAHPIPLSTISLSNFTFPAVFEVQGGMGYFSDSFFYSPYSGLMLYDFSDPAQPYLFAIAKDPQQGNPYDASVGETLIFTARSSPITVFSVLSDLEGKVTDHNHKPVEGVTLTLNTGVETNSGADGSYNFPELSPGTYTVTPTLGAFAFAPAYREINLPEDSAGQNFIIMPAPVSAILEPGITTSLIYTDVQGLPTSFIFPAELVSITTTALITPTLASGFFGADFAGHAFELALDTGLPGEQIGGFTLPVSVTIQYSLDDTLGITETVRLALYSYDVSGWVRADTSCLPPGSAFVQEPGVFRGAVCSEGRYALLGPVYAVALPMEIFNATLAACEPPDCIPMPPLTDQE